MAISFQKLVTITDLISFPGKLTIDSFPFVLIISQKMCSFSTYIHWPRTYKKCIVWYFPSFIYLLTQMAREYLVDKGFLVNRHRNGTTEEKIIFLFVQSLKLNSTWKLAWRKMRVKERCDVTNHPTHSIFVDNKISSRFVVHGRFKKYTNGLSSSKKDPGNLLRKKKKWMKKGANC